MIKEEIRLIITEATEFLSKSYEKLQDLNEQLSMEEMEDKKKKIINFNQKELDLIKAWTQIILKKNGELTFKLLSSKIQEKVSPDVTLTYQKLKAVLDKFPEFVKKTTKGAKKMGRTPFVYSFILKKGGHIR